MKNNATILDAMQTETELCNLNVCGTNTGSPVIDLPQQVSPSRDFAFGSDMISLNKIDLVGEEKEI